MEDKYITQEGLDRLKKELEILKKDERIKVAEELKTAISFGDLSENAAYDDAKENQAQLEARILEVEKLIHNAKVIKHNKKGWVEVGSMVTLTDGKSENTYQIVGEEEANPLENRLSFKSPLGSAMINKPEGAKIKIQTPKGAIEYKILKIN
ncbi:MAG: transcription elongation factor GreA [Candidatus Pacebacteria bacterium]|nr:transcription elongation factor GreA [Candidatus Paceibacterota bacterium]